MRARACAYRGETVQHASAEDPSILGATLGCCARPNAVVLHWLFDRPQVDTRIGLDHRPDTCCIESRLNLPDSISEQDTVAGFVVGARLQKRGRMALKCGSSHRLRAHDVRARARAYFATKTSKPRSLTLSQNSTLLYSVVPALRKDV
jgi:hypothetical protein